MEKRCLFLVISFFCVISITAQQQFPDYMLDLVEKAKAGDAKSQCSLADFYNLGLEVDENKEEAFKWYLKSAEGGYPEGQRSAGVCYMKGEGTKQDISKAIYWFKKSGDSGCNKAYYQLGSYYWEGKFVDKNLETAFNYFIVSARQGLPEAQYIVGRMYLLGDGVEKDLVKAIEWYQKAAEAGHLMSQSQLGTIYLDVDEVMNFEKATYWNKKAADAKHPRALYSLGKQYLYGMGVTKNTTLGHEYLEQAANLKNVDAINFLGYMAMEGIGMAKDRKKAREWFIKALAIDPTNHDAQVFLFALDQGLDQKDDSGEDNSILPVSQKPAAPRSDIYAVVIGNESYKNEAAVPFAENDAKAFKDYLVSSLGLDEASQVKFTVNAGLNDMLIALNWLENAVKANDGQVRVVFYYAGHGIPNESDRSAYLLPVDGIGTMPRSALSLKELYELMGQLNARSITVFLDACFSGSKREGGMLTSARGVAIKAKTCDPLGKMVVFSAAQGDETAYSYKEQQHGLFTYYLLKKLRESDGNVSYGELNDYLKKEVCRQSLRTNNKVQTPDVNTSSALANSWRQLKLR